MGRNGTCSLQLEMNEDEPEQGFGKLYVLSLVVLMVLSFVAACIASKWI